MSTLIVFAFLGPISWFYHPDVMVNGRCIAEPGTYTALWCEQQPKPVARRRQLSP